jgi:hypothetical protein
VRLIVRTVLGLGMLAGGLTCFCYGLAQAIENGSCGTDKYGRAVGPPCPSGTGPMILLMVLGVFVAFAGGAVFASRIRGRGGMAFLGGGMLFLLALFASGIAAAVFGIVDLHDDDTRPGNEIVIAVLAAVLLPAIPALLRRRPETTPVPPLMGTPLVFASAPAQAPPPAASFGTTSPPPAPSPPINAAARAEDIASRLRQLEQLKESGLLSGDEYDQRRRQILSEL